MGLRLSLGQDGREVSSTDRDGMGRRRSISRWIGLLIRGSWSPSGPCL